LREQPTADELLEIVAQFLREEVVPKLSGPTAYHARVAANVVDIVRREMALAPEALTAELERLRALVGHDGDSADLNRELCALIAAGAIDLHDPALLDHLWATTLETVAIDQPRYATFRRCNAGAEGDA
jgi:hypothetical protein